MARPIRIEFAGAVYHVMARERGDRDGSAATENIGVNS